jgi:hypothetical protein
LPDQFLRERSYPIDVSAAPPNVHLRVAAIVGLKVMPQFYRSVAPRISPPGEPRALVAAWRLMTK